MGACGVIVGTRLIATPEAGAANAYKNAVIDSGPEDIVYSNRITGNWANWIKKSIERVEATPELGSKKWLNIWSAGQSVAQAEDIRPAGDIVREMAASYAKVSKNLQNTIVLDG